MPGRSRQKSQPTPTPTSIPTDTTSDEDLTASTAPTDIDPYAVLSVPSDATPDAIKTAYRKAALKHHPDKAAPSDAATAKEAFQRIAFAYAVLSDPARRRLYDATGSTAEVLADADFDWQDYYAALYADAVTEDAIAAFRGKYKGSAEERGDVLAAYEKVKGDMERLYTVVMLSEPVEDEERFRGMIGEAIEKGEVEAHRKYTDESEKSREKRLERARQVAAREAKDVDKEKEKRKKGGGEGLGDLAALIQQRQKDRGVVGAAFFDRLEEKYGGGEKGKGKKRSAADALGEDEPSEEAFKAMGERMAKSKAQTAGDQGGKKAKKPKTVSK